jgi:carbon-monoxide dehydrogenase medium subunit
MKPAPFTYHAPRTAAEAVSALAEYGDEAKVLAGGQSLVPMLALRLARPAHLIDVNGVAELTGSRRENGQLVAGAMTRHAALERDREIAAAVPLQRCRREPGHHNVHGLPAAHRRRGPRLRVRARGNPVEHPGGYKGLGEGGAIASPPALLNAVRDALAPLGVTLTEQDLSPDKILALIENATAG